MAPNVATGASNYQFAKELGKGTYGQVSLVKDLLNNRQLVQKSIDLSTCSGRTRKGAELEVKLLSTLKHPNIVRYRDSHETEDGKINIFMEYCEQGDLYRMICRKVDNDGDESYYPEVQCLEWFVQITMALQYMHERNVLHRDLKTQNIFLTKDDIIKVGDFGISRILDSTADMATTLIGTPYYMSPEIFANKPYNHKSDVWALGCCLYEISTLRHAFNANDLGSLMYKITKGKVPPLPPCYSIHLSKLVTALLHVKPEKRPSAGKILRHPFIKKHIIGFLKKTSVQLGRAINQNITDVTKSTSTIDAGSNGYKMDSSQPIKADHNIRVSISNTNIHPQAKHGKFPNISIESKESTSQAKQAKPMSHNKIQSKTSISTNSTTSHAEGATRKRRSRKSSSSQRDGCDENGYFSPIEEEAKFIQELDHESHCNENCSFASVIPRERARSAPGRDDNLPVVRQDRNVVSAGQMRDTKNAIPEAGKGPNRTSYEKPKLPKISESDLNQVIDVLNETLHLKPVICAHHAAGTQSEEDSDCESNDIKPTKRSDGTHGFRRASALKRQCSMRLSRRTLAQAFEIMDANEGLEMEEALRCLLKDDFKYYGPLLAQLRMYEDGVNV